MKCKRCQGLCVAEEIEEYGRYIPASRCLSCGDLVYQTLFEETKNTQKRNGKKLGAGKKTNTPTYKKNHNIKKICA